MKNKINFLILLLISLSLLACSSSDDSSNDNSSSDDLSSDVSMYSFSDFEPATGKAPNAKSLDETEEDPGSMRLLMAVSEDGVYWERKNEVFIDRVGAPDAVVDSDGRIFLYYMSGTEGIEDLWVAAVSEDQGETWVHKYVNVEGAGIGKIADTTTIILEDGTFRSYFQSHFSGDAHGHIRSAISKDGLNFVLEEGVRVEGSKDGGIVIAPLVLQVNGEVHLYAHGTSARSLSEMNEHFVSKNGIDFEEAEVPFVDMLFANSSYIDEELFMYGFAIADGDKNFHSSLFYTKTIDGYVFDEAVQFFSVDEKLSNGLEYFMLKEPMVIELLDGSYLMFYLTGIE